MFFSVIVIEEMMFQCCVTTLPSCGVGGNDVSVLCNHSAKLWCWW